MTPERIKELRNLYEKADRLTNDLPEGPSWQDDPGIVEMGGEAMRALPELLDEIKNLKDELEQEKLRLVACGIAAMQNTDATIKNRLKLEDPCWSPAYQDVCTAVDKEIYWRNWFQKMKNSNKQILDTLSKIK